MPARFNYPSLPGNPDSTQPKSALGIYRDRPSSAHPVTTITPPHGECRHYASRANPNKEDAYD